MAATQVELSRVLSMMISFVALPDFFEFWAPWDEQATTSNPLCGEMLRHQARTLSTRVPAAMSGLKDFLCIMPDHEGAQEK